ncbi:hypothetical protein TgHK011_005179 [Trichoderma gracile]|nr:hypothetical protein TgHK011_005179 [Trichoderma gracile]
MQRKGDLGDFKHNTRESRYSHFTSEVPGSLSFVYLPIRGQRESNSGEVRVSDDDRALSRVSLEKRMLWHADAEVDARVDNKVALSSRIDQVARPRERSA